MKRLIIAAIATAVLAFAIYKGIIETKKSRGAYCSNSDRFCSY